jgi:hypothetical protein
MMVQLCPNPEDIAADAGSSSTVTGMSNEVAVASPSWPQKFRPQQLTEPSLNKAQV